MTSTLIKYVASLKATGVGGLVAEDQRPGSETQTNDDEEARIAQQDDLAKRHKSNYEEREKLRNEIRKKYGLKNPNDERKGKISKLEVSSEDAPNQDSEKTKSCCAIV